MLDQVARLFADSCYLETIQLGQAIREARQDKFFSASSEFAELFVPEGSVTPYVLESYERGYLSLLISLSYMHQANSPHEAEAASVEMRRASSEAEAVRYNYGDDPVVTLLQAAITDRLDPDEARPFWQRLAEFKIGPEVESFVQARLNEIDTGSMSNAEWKIYGCGKMPVLDWQISSSSLYRIRTRTPFPANFHDKDSLMVSTESWTGKIERKYSASYHPYLLTKSLMRLPIGLGYGVAGVTGGAAIGLGGCFLAAEMSGDSSKLCEVAFKLGGYVIAESADLLSFTLQPDLRHWSELPSAIVITRSASTVSATLACAARGIRNGPYQSYLE